MLTTFQGTPGFDCSFPFAYVPVHVCSVCGKDVYDVYPFAADCSDCTLWAALIFCGGEKC